jgi:hypothetical protein
MEMLYFVIKRNKMNVFLISLLIGLAAAIIDIVPMIIKKLDKYAIVSAFSAWVILGIFIPRINLVSIPLLNGIIVALLFNLPTMCLIFKVEKKGVIPILIITCILGSGIGFFSNMFLR